MENTRRWIQTLALAGLAVAALLFVVRGSQAAVAGQPRVTVCQDFIPAEGVSDLSVVDSIRIWMNAQTGLNRDKFIVVHSVPTDRATVLCAW